LDLTVKNIPICRGAICQNGVDILQSKNANFKGTLHFYDFNGKEPPHYSGLGTRWVLLYVLETEKLPEYFYL
jgi:hypothetical protein